MKVDVLIGFGEKNEFFSEGAPWLVSCEEIETKECFDNGLRIIISYGDDKFEIIFRNYSLHQTRAEHLTCWDDYEVHRGNCLVTFDRSRLLDYWEQVILHTEDEVYPGKRYHYGVYTETHLIDVITSEKPVIEKIAP